MKLYVPRVGDQIKLLNDWRFKSQKEHRNESFIDAYWKYEENQQLDDDDIFSDLAIGRSDLKHGEITDVVVPVNTVLAFDRLYIRKGASSGWDSITFKITECPIKEFVKKRFWVKIPDANKIEYELVGTKDMLAPNIEIESLHEYNCRKGCTKYFYRDSADTLNSLYSRLDNDEATSMLESGVFQEQYNVKVNGELKYNCVLSILFDIEVCQFLLEDIPNIFDLNVVSTSFKLYTLDDNELFKVGAYSTLKTKIKKQYIKDTLSAK